MTRKKYGGGTADVVEDAAGNRTAGLPLYFFTDEALTVPVTDLRDWAGAAFTAGPVATDQGEIKVQGPDGYTGPLFVATSDDGGVTFLPWSRLDPADLAARLANVEAGTQPLSPDLTAIGALSPTNNDLLQRKSGVWANRTPAQVKTDLALVKADVGLGSVDNTADAAKPVSAAQQAAINLAISNLVAGAPGALDTLLELANQFATDESAATALASAVALKLAKASNLSDVASASAARSNLGLGDAATHAAADFLTPTQGNAAYPPIANTPKKIMATLSALGAHPVMWDFYDRPDRTLAFAQSGEGTPSGHRYTTDSTGSVATIVSRRQTWSDETTGGATPLRWLPVQLGIRPTVIVKAVVFTDGSSTHSHNSVVGCCEVSFSDTSGSIQFCVRGNSTFDLFYTDWLGAGGTLQIPVVVTGALPVTLVQDGSTVYVQALKWDPVTSTVSCYLDGVLLGSWTDPKVNSYWGHKACSQFRKNATTDGVCRAAGFAAGAPSDPPTGLPAAVVLPGTHDTYVSCTPPQSMIDTPLTDLELIVSAPQLPTGGVYNVFASRWRDGSSQGQASWAVGLNPTFKGVIWITPDGTTASATRTIEAPTAMPSGLPWKFTYNHTTGDFKCYSSADGGSTWTQVGTTVQVPSAGAPYAAARTTPIEVGTREFSSTLCYSGPLNYVQLNSGIGGSPVAIADFTRVWAKPSQMDPYGLLWRLTGNYAWQLTTAGVPTPSTVGTTLTAVRTTDATPVNNSNVVASDSVLTIPNVPIGTWEVTGTLFYDSATAADLRVKLSTPTSTTGQWALLGPATTTGASGVTSGTFLSTDLASPIFIGGGGVGTSEIMLGELRATITTTQIGTVAVQWAQQTADATNTTLRTGSKLKLLKLA